MDELLTARQVQEILKVERITVYRMLSDGRLKGIKIGQQWRFQASEVNRLLAGEATLLFDQDAEAILPRPTIQNEPSRSRFPVHCIQIMQDLYAGLGKIGAVTVMPDGEPLTTPSQWCDFCGRMQATPAGRAACKNSWARNIKKNPDSGWRTCHAGLRYYQSPIAEAGAIVAFLISGPAYHSPPDPMEQEQRLRGLAEKYGMAARELLDAAYTVPVIWTGMLEDIENWPPQFAKAIEAMLEERADLVRRLQKIAEISEQAI